MEDMLNATYDWENKLLLGQGAHSIVYKIKHRERDQYYAIKQFKKKNSQSQTSLRNQLECLRKIKHKNIVKLYSYFRGDDVSFQILQYCQKTLRKSMQVSGQSVQKSQREAVQIIREIIQGMLELNKHNLIHRDLKPENILLKQKTIKICDFGLTVYCSQHSPCTQYCGTPLYMSPQISSQKPYTSKTDIWSIGIIFYEMIYGTTPWKFDAEVNYKTYIKNNPLHFPEDVIISSCSKHFIERCLQIQQKDRMNWEGVASHPLVNLGIKMVSQIQVLEANQLIQSLSYIYLDNPKSLQTSFFENSYDNSLNMLQFFKKMKKIQLDRQITPRQSRLIFQKMDYNKNGKVSFDEFKKILSKLSNSSLILRNIKEQVKKKSITQKVLVKVGITPEVQYLDSRQFELLVKFIMPSVVSSQIKKLFQKLDQDQDNKISKAQIIELLRLADVPMSHIIQPSCSLEILAPSSLLSQKSISKSPISRTQKSPRYVKKF